MKSRFTRCPKYHRNFQDIYVKELMLLICASVFPFFSQAHSTFKHTGTMANNGHISDASEKPSDNLNFSPFISATREKK